MAVINPPTPATLAKYGLSEGAWRGLLAEQGGVCPVCDKQPPSGRLVIDHEHVKGWKHLEASERRRYVRGLLCWTCNHYALARGMSVQRARNIAMYLQLYEHRRDEVSQIKAAA